MATVTATETPTPVSGRNYKVFKWTGVNDGDTCVGVITASFTDIVVSFTKSGAFGGSMSLQGAPDPTPASHEWLTLDDAANVAISGKTSGVTKTVLQHKYQMRPVAGAGVGAVDVYLELGSAR